MRRSRALCLLLASAFFGCGDEGGSSYDDEDGGLPPGEDGGMDAQAGDGAVAGGNDAAVVEQAITRVVSVPPKFALIGERYAYRPRTNGAVTLAFQLTNPPAGMNLANGVVEWLPTAPTLAGEHPVALSAQAGSATVAQSYTLTVAKATELTFGTVSEEGGKVFAEDGKAGITVPAGALPDGVRLTVSELSQAPSLPNTTGRIRALSFGPSGQVFAAPAIITLPLPDAGDVPLSKQNLSALVYDPSSGRWERVEVIAVDLENGVLTARAQHFSVYAAAQSALSLNLALTAAPSSGACGGSLLAQAEMAAGIAGASAAAINNLDPQYASALGANGTLQQLLALPSFRGSLRAVQVLRLVERLGGAEVPVAEQLIATTLYVPGDGSAVVTHADALGNVLSVRRYATLSMDAVTEILVRLSGAATAGRFTASADDDLGVSARVHLLYFAGDAATDPLSGDELGLAAVEQAPVAYAANLTIADVDCDGVLDGYDASDDRQVPRVDAEPTALVTLAPNAPTSLRASLRNAPSGTTSEWLVTSGTGAVAGLLTETSDAATRVFRAPQPGRYTVTFRARAGATQYAHQFAVEVIPPPATNTPPTCTPTKELLLGRVGDPVPLSAVTQDRESTSSTLLVEWGLVPDAAQPTLVASPALSALGARALFSPTSAGAYTVGCRAYDGQLWGGVSVVRVPLIAADQNRPPSGLTLTPMVLTVAPDQAYSLQASAQDADGDALTFSWTINGAPTDVAPVQEGGSSRIRLTAPAQTGKLTVRVAVNDGKLPEPLVAAAEVVISDSVTPPADAGTGLDAGRGDAGARDAGTDAGSDAGSDASASDAGTSPEPTPGFDEDEDGFLAAPDGNDCNDNDAFIRPNAPEICGDKLDNDCDGVIDDGCVAPPLDAGVTDAGGVDAGLDAGRADAGFDAGPSELLDRDQDDWTPEEGDCDDGNPEINPEATDVCGDRIDNDCDFVVDQNCPDAGSADAGMPWIDNDQDKVPLPFDCNDSDPFVRPNAPELCGDKVDNNCNGLVDESCAGSDAGIMDGGPRDAGSDAGPAGDGGFPVPTLDYDNDGYFENDCDPFNSKVNPGAVEACDGFDNNCNEQVDEGCVTPMDGGLGDAGVPGSDAGSLDGGSPSVDGGGVESVDFDEDSWPAWGPNGEPIDCDDEDFSVHPGQSEVCNGIDDDCDGVRDEGCGGLDGGVPGGDGGGVDGVDGGALDGGTSDLDADGDGFTLAEGDCNDADPDINPDEPEWCGDGIDNDCDNETDDADLCIPPGGDPADGGSDGGEPVDAGILPGIDAGLDDAGAAEDAGELDAGTEPDPAEDAGIIGPPPPPDAGVDDADAAEPDAGELDAGAEDAGAAEDADVVDADVDAETADADVDAETADADVDAETADADVDAETADAEVDAETADADVDAETADAEAADAEAADAEAADAEADAGDDDAGEPDSGV